MVSTRYLGLIPVTILMAAFLIVIATVYPESSSTPIIFVPPASLTASILYFRSLSALAVAYFLGRAYLSNGSSNLIALGAGSLILGLGSLLAGILGSPPFGGFNQLFGITGLTILLSGILFGGFAIIGLFGKTGRLEKPKVPLALAYIGCVVAVAASTAAVEAGLTPDFFVQGVGNTIFRQQIVFAGITTYFLSSIILIRNYLRSHARVLYWFSFGLASYGVTAVSGALIKVFGGPFTLLADIAIVVGSSYLLAAVVSAYSAPKVAVSP